MGDGEVLVSWIDDYVAIEERRAALLARDREDADDIVHAALLDARLHGHDAVAAVRDAVNAALLDG